MLFRSSGGPLGSVGEVVALATRASDMAPGSCGGSPCVDPPPSDIVPAVPGDSSVAADSADCVLLASSSASCRPDQVRHVLAFHLRAPAEARQKESSMVLGPIEHKVDPIARAVLPVTAARS